MKDLRASESISASEVADVSALSIVNGEDDNEQFANEMNADGSLKDANGGVQFDPTAAHDESLDLNEDDLFRYVSFYTMHTYFKNS